MKKNVGSVDRIIRLIVAGGVGILYWLGLVQGALAYVLLAGAGVFALTSFISFCPIYALVGLSTCKVKK